ncbi:MAG: neutral/alkaline non-lysosomal ceramidase N-terminal domain-containing protein [bacterium]
MRGWWLCAALAVAGCDDGPADTRAADLGADAGGLADAAPADARPQDAAPPDAGPLDADLDAALVDAQIEDAFVGDAAWLPLDPARLPPPPAPLRAGVATRRMDVPLGIGTSGFGPGQASPYATPYQVSYPGTRHIHLHPDFRAVVLEAGAGNRLYFVRTDTIGISARIRRDLIERLEARYGGDIDRQLVIAATHTHSGPGRLIDKPLWRIIQDVYWPAFYERVLDGLEQTIVAAVDDLEPARLGVTVASTTALHHDRRCANPAEDDPDLPILRLDRADGRLKGLVLFHTIHGTVLGMDDYTLSQDATGGIEAKVAELFDDPVFVMFLNGAAADMSPGSPAFPAEPEAAAWPDPYTRVEQIGRAAAEVVAGVVADIETHTDVVLHSRTARVPSAATCSATPTASSPSPTARSTAAWPSRSAASTRRRTPPSCCAAACLPRRGERGPHPGPLTVGQIDGLGFITTPGEFSISLGRVAREAAEAALGLPVVTIGYAQEYTGCSLTEDDWWHAGYETSGALWGPRQGDWLAAAIASLARSYANPRLPLAFADQPPLAARVPPAPDPFSLQPAIEAPTVLAEVAAELGPADVATFEFSGGDPGSATPW